MKMRMPETFLLKLVKVKCTDVPLFVLTMASAAQLKKNPEAKAAQKKAEKEAQDQIKWDWSRATGPNQSDPRCLGAPCHGAHRPAPAGRGSVSGANGSAKWTGCAICGLRLEYVPKVGKTGIYRSAGPLPADVTSVMEAKGNELTTEDLTTQKIGITAAEMSLKKQWDHLQQMKGKISDKIGVPISDKLKETMESENTTAEVTKKAVKRGNQNTPEHQEQATSAASDVTSTPSWEPVNTSPRA